MGAGGKAVQTTLQKLAGKGITLPTKGGKSKGMDSMMPTLKRATAVASAESAQSEVSAVSASAHASFAAPISEVSADSADSAVPNAEAPAVDMNSMHARIDEIAVRLHTVEQCTAEILEALHALNCNPTST